ncbi:MAG TPA: tetratricopeptide repeat protein, partial [Longimicrobium sp.]|nr:tetratricopeptide repeat protein [Longimicrobium sp.]
VLAISREHKFLLWLLWASLVKCWAEVRLGRHDRIQAMREHLEQWTREGRRSGMPHNLGMMADMYLCAGQVDEGLEMLRQAFDWLERVGERSYEVELHRLHGELSRRRGDQALARESFERAVSIANEQGASGFGLRAVVSLARQRLELGFAAEARALLERSLARVEPRPDWPDSVAAARLLARLGERGASPFAPWE